MDEGQAEALQKKWDALGIDIPLEVVHSPYRDLVKPLEDYLSLREGDTQPGGMITVVVSRFMENHWIANILHNQTAFFLVRRLRAHRNVATVLVPYLYGRQ